MEDITAAAEGEQPIMAEDATKKYTVASTLADPQYRAGRKLIDDGRLEEAVNFFSGLLETRVAVLSGNEMNPSLAPLYYEYGNSLLYNAEESGAVFGDAVTDAEKKRAMAIVEAQVGGEDKEEEGGSARASDAQGGGAEDGGEQAPSPDQEAEEDLEIAWENLEMARRIYSELELTEEVRTAIAKVHLRLGDLNMVNGMYNEAADEFDKCLQHRLALPSPKSRGVADAHVRRAQALFYASTLEGANKDALVALSLEQYRLAAGIFEVMIASRKEEDTLPQAQRTGKENNGDTTEPCGSSSTANSSKGKGKGRSEESETTPPAAVAAGGGSAEELQDVLDAIKETIETMVSGKDMEALAEYKSGAVSTTVGFGEVSSLLSGGAAAAAGGGGSSGNTVEVTTVGFGGGSLASTGFGGAGGQGGVSGASVSSSSAPGAASASSANVMVVKRKGRPAPKAISGGAGAGGAGAACEGASVGGGDDASKKAKSKE